MEVNIIRHRHPGPRSPAPFLLLVNRPPEERKRDTCEKHGATKSEVKCSDQTFLCYNLHDVRFLLVVFVCVRVRV